MMELASILGVVEVLFIMDTSNLKNKVQKTADSF